MDDQEVLAKLAKDFHELVNNPEELHTSTENFLDQLIDDLTLGVIFNEHRKSKTGIYDEDVAEVSEVDNLNQPTDQKLLKQYCACPNCDRSVAAEKFAQHLASCMGLGRSRPSRQRRTSSNSSKSEESDTSSCQGPSRQRRTSGNSSKSEESNTSSCQGPSRQRRTSGNSSKSEESDTSSCQGPSKHKDGEVVTSSVKRGKQQHHSTNKDDKASTSGSSRYKRGKKKQYKKSSQESPNNVSSTGISVDTGTLVDSFDELTAQKIQQYCCICPKCNCAVDVEKFTPHLASCTINTSKKESSSTSKSQESPNNLSSAGIGVGTHTIVDSFNQLNVQKMQQYCICPKCDWAVDVEKLTPHLASCQIDKCEPSTSKIQEKFTPHLASSLIDKCEPSTSKIQECSTFLCQEPGKDENGKDLIPSSERDETYSINSSDIEIDVVGVDDLPCLLASDGDNNNSVTTYFTNIVSISDMKRKSKRKKKKRVKYSSTFDTNQEICNQPKIQKTQQYDTCPKWNRAEDAERFTPDLASYMEIETDELNRETSESSTTLCQGPSKDRNTKDSISKREEEKQNYKSKRDTDLSSGHKQTKKKQVKKARHKSPSNLTENKVDEVGDKDLPLFSASVEENSLTPDLADSVPNSSLKKKSERKKKKRVWYSP